MAKKRNPNQNSSQPIDHRKSLRLATWDYRKVGFYCVTIVTQGRVPRFGAVRESAVSLSPAGDMVRRRIEYAEKQFGDVTNDFVVIMPDHVHWIIGFGTKRDRQSDLPHLGQVIGWFKAMTTFSYAVHVRCSGWAPFEKRLWQRGYHDRIIRNEEEKRIRSYIDTNPARWQARYRLVSPSQDP